MNRFLHLPGSPVGCLFLTRELSHHLLKSLLGLQLVLLGQPPILLWLPDMLTDYTMPLYLSTVHQIVTYLLFPGDAGSPAPECDILTFSWRC